MKKKKYWNGSIRLASDLFWSSSIIYVFSLWDNIGINIGVFIYCVLWVFFLFFFASWNKEHCKSRCARWGIHIICGVFLLVLLVFFGMSAIYTIADIYSEIGWIALILTGTPLVLFGFKYKRLMWAK
ncbi:MAG: hypothetical protein K1060chlam1_01269 [Candidatus Anoxychlamydiales bacterium]|nr:hypothetical protein [Candidatus Anoxychlamydiales bacterium]